MADFKAYEMPEQPVHRSTRYIRRFRAHCRHCGLGSPAAVSVLGQPLSEASDATAYVALVNAMLRDAQDRFFATKAACPQCGSDDVPLLDEAAALQHHLDVGVHRR